MRPMKSMRPFNPERARAGNPVVTREGQPVTNITFFDGVDGESIFAVVGGKVRAWHEAGNYLHGEMHHLDLLMAPIVKKGWVNIFRASDGVWRVQGPIYFSEFNARSNANCNEITTPIEWEAGL